MSDDIPADRQTGAFRCVRNEQARIAALMQCPENGAMRVLLWSPGGSGAHYHGPASFSSRLYLRRDPKQLRVSLVHGCDEQEPYPDVFESEAFLPGLTPRRQLLGPSFISTLDRYRRRLIFARQGRRWLEKHFGEFDIFHGLGSFAPTLLPALHAVRLGLPACATVTIAQGELTDQSSWRRLLKFSERRLAMMSRLDAIIALSRDIEGMLLERGVPEGRVVYIPNCVDTSRFTAAASSGEKCALQNRFGLGNEPVIAFVGGLTERKRVHLILQALHKLADLRLGWQLVLAGPAREEAYARQLKAYVASHGWSNRVHFLGHVNNIDEVFKVADIYCLLSKDEGMPGALLEAMACGLACMITPFSSAHELIEDGMNGRIVPPSPSAVADALREYLRDDRLRTIHGSAARDRVLAGYSTEKVLMDHVNLFRRLQAGKPPRPD